MTTSSPLRKDFLHVSPFDDLRELRDRLDVGVRVVELLDRTHEVKIVREQRARGLEIPGSERALKLLEDPRMIRSRSKIEATIANAETMLDLDREHKGFKRYLRSHDDFEATVKDLRKRFKFLGDHGAYRFLWIVGEKVPSWHEWAESRGMTATAGGRARTRRRS